MICSLPMKRPWNSCDERAQTELPAAGIAAVQQRTEGWAAGLELLAHSLRGCDDVPGLLESFTGSNRHVLDYLMEEVFQRQPASIQDFLLETSLLDRMSASAVRCRHRPH